MVPNLFMITGVEDIVILTIIYIIFTVEIWRNHKKKFYFKSYIMAILFNIDSWSYQAFKGMVSKCTSHS